MANFTVNIPATVTRETVINHLHDLDAFGAEWIFGMTVYLTEGDGALAVVTYEDPESGQPDCVRIDNDRVMKGLKRMSLLSPHHMTDLVEESGDIITAEVMLQYFIFGEIIYG